MLRLPVRPLTGALISALVIATTSLLGSAPVNALPTGDESAAARVAATSIEFDTDLTLEIARCEDCVVTLFSYDGVNPIDSYGPATVTDGSVTITLPSARTAGMSVRIQPPWVTAVATDTNVAWRYNGTEIGDRIGFRKARAKRRASGCWAGTVNEAVTLTVKVRKVPYRGRPGAIAWAPVTESYVPPMETTRRGVLVSDDVLACNIRR